MNAGAHFAIPADLRARRQWVGWRRECRDGKATKVPYRATDPRVRASTTDARTWGSFDQAVAAVDRGKAEGIGFVFADSDPFCGIDLDGCRGEEGELSADAAAIVEELDSYTELSPSGRGVHVIVRARLEGARCRRGPVEMYDRGRYFTMTGARLAGLPHAPMPRQQQLHEVRARLFPPTPEPVRPPVAATVIVVDDEQLLVRAHTAANGAKFARLWNGDTSEYGGDDSRADLALISLLVFWTAGDVPRVDRLFRRSGLYRSKWEREDYRVRTITAALSGRADFYQAMVG
jgi:primase-polymerase (primpol)-like protein